MAEETQPQEETAPSIWERLEIDPDEAFSAAAEEAEQQADEEIEKEDKVLKSLSRKVDEMEKRAQRQELGRIIDKYEAQADDLHKELFAAVKSKVKDPESLAQYIELVDKQAEEMSARLAKYEEQTKQQISSAWGSGNPGKPQPPEPVAEDEVEKRVAAGDTRLGFAELMKVRPTSMDEYLSNR